MARRSIPVFYSGRFKEHETGAHPEQPKRMDCIRDALKETFAAGEIGWVEPKCASLDVLQKVHSKPYIDRIETMANQGGGMADPDTVVCPASFEIARLSTGASVDAVDLLFQNNEPVAFALSRPPGHHAFAGRAMGFCLFNNVAVAARYAQDRYQIDRVMIVDWDVHHGNGTQDIFYSDPSVYYISTHQHPHYPGTGLADETGSGDGKGFTKNLPFPAHTPAETVVRSFCDTFQEIASHFQPEFIIISAGFDGHRDDPLGNWLLLESDFAALTAVVCRYAQEKTIRVLSSLEGGYNLKSLSQSYVSHLKALTNR